MPRRDIAFCFVICRDNEDAYVSVNGKTCWSKTNLLGTSGTQECGGAFKEESFRVTGCYVAVEENVPLTMSAWTSLDSDARDESFAIANVIVQNIGKGCPGCICANAGCHEVAVYVPACIPCTYTHTYTN